MNDHTPKPSTVAAAFIVPALLVLIGAGCFGVADKLAENAVTPVAVPVEALKKSKEALAIEKAKQNEANEMVSDDVTVAMIYTDKAEGESTLTMGETIGCDDRIGFVKVHRAASTDSLVHDALATLFSVKETGYNGLYNAIANSSLAVEKIQSADGVTTEVWLKGTLVSGGACDSPRAKAQIEHTVKRFKPTFKIILNGSESAWRCFGDESGTCK